MDAPRQERPLEHAEFLTTAATWQQLPAGGVPEIAFAGRSNAGKSSAINALARRTALAFVSKTPGRTQNINFFRLRNGALLADLPGYGYARVPRDVQQRWQTFIARYLTDRGALAGLVLIVDARRLLTDLDRQMLDWFLPSERPVHVLLTKSDKLSRSEAARALDAFRESLAREYARRSARVTAQLFSATRSTGIEEAESAIASFLPGASLRSG